MLNNDSLTDFLIRYKKETSYTIFGIWTLENISVIPDGNYIDSSLKKDERTFFLIHRNNFEKFENTFEILYNEMKYERKSLASIILLGANFSYDDSEDSGLSIYSSFGVSSYINHNEGAKKEIFKNILNKNVNEGNALISQFHDSFCFDKNKVYYGGATLFGIRKDFDLFMTDFFVNAEWFHTFGDWSSGNQGTPYDKKINQTFNIIDNSYNAILGWQINSSSLLRIEYTYLEYLKTGKIGAPAITVDNKKFISPNQIRKVEMFQLFYNYTF